MEDSLEGTANAIANANKNHEELEAVMIELSRTKKKLHRGKEHATQSWLDSKPLTDELEKLQSVQTKAKNRVSIATTATSALESQLNATNASIRLKKEEELLARTRIEEISRVLDQTRQEMERIKLETKEGKSARANLKQELHLKKQSIQTLQLTQRAISLESEAFGASAATVLHHLKHSETANDAVELSHEEYHALRRKANKEIELADWRISISVEQRKIAAASREEALRRFQEPHAGNKSTKSSMKVTGILSEEDTVKEAAKEVRTSQAPHNTIIKRSALHDRLMQAEVNEEPMIQKGTPQQKMRRSESNRNKKIVKRKKRSILNKIRSFLARNIRKIFG